MNNHDQITDSENESEYQFLSESYDFRPYQSMDTQNHPQELIGFKYNQSLIDVESNK